MTAETWHNLANLIPLPWWLLMILLPKAAITRKLTQNYAIFLALAALYLIFLILGMTQLPPTSTVDFRFDQLRQSLGQSELLFVGAWLHYLVFDLFVGFWIYKQGLRLNIPVWQTGICLLFTLLAGPLGLGLFLIRRQFALPSGSSFLGEG
jgi:hypothetical protein